MPIFMFYVALAFAAWCVLAGGVATLLAVLRSGRRALTTIGAGVVGAAVACLLWRVVVWEETGEFITGIEPAFDVACGAIGYGCSAGLAFVAGELLAGLCSLARPNQSLRQTAEARWPSEPCPSLGPRRR